MKNILSLSVLFMLKINILFAQNTFKVYLKDEHNNEALVGASGSLSSTSIGSLANIEGLIEIKNIPSGKQKFSFSMIGYQTKNLTFDIPQNEIPTIFLAPDEEELEEIIITTTRLSRSIEKIPTRIEAISMEEIDEKNNMRSANISMLLHESTGIQVQQTSATSANAGIRIQGLDGRYTQILKDGYPNFGRFAGTLSVLEIPPLDLRQVEIIKGSASTLYGGGAIAGVVNLVSKEPKEEREINFQFAQSAIGQTDASIFSSGKKNKVGFTVLGMANFQKLYDVDKDDFTELPESQSFTFHPKLFLYPSENATIIIGNSTIVQNRKGGDVTFLNDKGDSFHSFFENNETFRNISQIEWRRKIDNNSNLTFKNSFSHYRRLVETPNTVFDGTQNNFYSELSYIKILKKHNFVSGLNFIYDNFKEGKSRLNLVDRSFRINTFGAYLQDTWDATEKVSIEAGLRSDFASKYGAFILPRISALFKLNEQISTRIGGGMGYKTPSIFTEEAERQQFTRINLNKNTVAEKSIVGTADVNFTKEITEDLSLSFNQLFFLTKLHNPIILEIENPQSSVSNSTIINASEPIISKGFETNLRMVFKENYKFFVGYTFTDAQAKYLKGNQFIPLVPKNKVNLALVYEKHGNLKAGLEGYFTDRQYLNDGSQSPNYWEFGAMIEKTIKKVAIYINFENFTDTRQSRFKRVVNEPPHQNPTFDDIYTHTEGFVMSVGLKIKL